MIAGPPCTTSVSVRPIFLFSIYDYKITIEPCAPSSNNDKARIENPHRFYHTRKQYLNTIEYSFFYLLLYHGIYIQLPDPSNKMPSVLFIGS